jgi:hypothetical protein
LRTRSAASALALAADTVIPSFSHIVSASVMEALRLFLVTWLISREQHFAA